MATNSVAGPQVLPEEDELSGPEPRDPALSPAGKTTQSFPHETEPDTAPGILLGPWNRDAKRSSVGELVEEGPTALTTSVIQSFHCCFPAV